MIDQECREPVQVFVRIRDVFELEREANVAKVWSWDDSSMIEETSSRQRMYTFDRCFDPSVRNQEVYELAVQSNVYNVLKGTNGTIITCMISHVY